MNHEEVKAVALKKLKEHYSTLTQENIDFVARVHQEMPEIEVYDFCRILKDYEYFYRRAFWNALSP